MSSRQERNALLLSKLDFKAHFSEAEMKIHPAQPDQTKTGGMPDVEQPDVVRIPAPRKETDDAAHQSDILHVIQTRYASNFTMHALNHIQDGSVLERIVWIIKLLGLFAAAVYICWGLFTGFLNHEVNTTIKSTMKISLKFPKMYLCTNRRDQFSGGMLRPSYKQVNGAIGYKGPGTAPTISPGTQHIPLGPCGGSWICNKPAHFGHCVVINDDGTLEQKAGMSVDTSELQVYQGHVIIDQPLEVWISTGEWKWGQGLHKAVVPRAGIYNFKFSKTIYHRLPAPYTDCVIDGSDLHFSLSMFNGSYSFEKCAGTCRIKAELELCGFITNEHTIYMRNEDYKSQLVNDTGNVNKIENCYHSFLRSQDMAQRVEACMAKCPAPCEEIKYDVDVSHSPGEIDRFGKTYEEQNITELRMEYKDFIVTEIGQQPAYELTSLISNFGGTLGLMCGMSAVSILELLIWMFLGIVVLVVRLHKKIN